MEGSLVTVRQLPFSSLEAVLPSIRFMPAASDEWGTEKYSVMRGLCGTASQAEAISREH
jgi:hypothetical protein